MSNKSAILESLRRNRAPEVSKPSGASFPRPDGDLPDLFTSAVEHVSGSVVVIGDGRYATVSEALRACYPDAEAVAASRSGWLESAAVIDGSLDPRSHASLDLFICEAEVGVCENGAVWLEDVGHPAAPFGAENLAVILRRQNLVWNLREACRHIDLGAPDFGCFVAGPSKTADIEQSLVIGAHGPKSLTVFLT